MPEPVTCLTFESLVVLYALGELDASARAGIEEHARVCSICAAMLQREVALADILSTGSRATGEKYPSDLLLARCRGELDKSLDEIAAAKQPRGWRSWLRPRNWAEGFRVSVDFHPAWSVAALLVVGVVSGLAGWEGLGREPLQQFIPAMITVSAAPPPPVVSTAPSAAAQAPAPNRPSMGGTAEDRHVYAATDAGMNGAPARSLFDAGAVEDHARRQAANALRRDEGSPRAWHNEPVPRMSPEINPPGAPPGAWDAPARGRFSELSRRMETLWWGGVRVDPAEQQKRLVLAPAPEYPEVARRAGIEGQVTLLLRIGRDGSVEDAQLLSGEPVLGRAAAEAVEQWRYQPVRIGGQPVNILTSVTLAFELR